MLYEGAHAGTNAVPKLSPDTVKMLDGAAVLFRRDRSSAWQVRYKANGKWVRTTTKQMAMADARKAAEDIVLNARFRERNNLPPVSRKFASVARTAVQRMKAELDAGRGKVVYKHYIAALQTYLIPFLGNHNVTSITSPLLREFDAWRIEVMRRSPKSSTIANHNAALHRVFDLALDKGYMTQSQLPVLAALPRDAQRRPDFTLDEYRQLFRFMRSWIKEGKAGKSRDMRELLRDYVLILANTGMRQGTESYGLKWKHLSEFEQGGRRYLAIWVDGKTGPRELIARHNCVAYFKRIHGRSHDIKHLSWDELLAKGVDKHVFRLPSGILSTNLHQTFEVLLQDAGLLHDRRTEQKRTLYSLRHMYATLALVKGHVDIHTLARQMGTSSLMIERHYSHLIPRQRAAELAGGMRPGLHDLKITKTL